MRTVLQDHLRSIHRMERWILGVLILTLLLAVAYFCVYGFRPDAGVFPSQPAPELISDAPALA